MKLYTEEQVKKMIEDMGSFSNGGIDYRINQMTSIELPSNEEIEKYANYAFPDAEKIGGESYTAMRGLKIGAKWVIEKIKQQGK